MSFFHSDLPEMREWSKHDRHYQVLIKIMGLCRSLEGDDDMHETVTKEILQQRKRVNLLSNLYHFASLFLTILIITILLIYIGGELTGHHVSFFHIHHYMMLTDQDRTLLQNFELLPEVHEMLKKQQ